MRSSDELAILTKPDLILHNGRIYPTGKSRTHFDALAIWKGRITDLGSNHEILSLAAKHTTRKNLHARVVLPGFCDSHIHLLGYGMLLRTLDLSRTRSIEEMKKHVSRASSQTSNDKWILGRGWDHEKLRDHRYPDRYDLDEATSNAVLLKRVCGHVAVANTKALSLAGISDDTSDPKGGVIVKDSNGKPNGVLKERAIEIVEKVVPQLVDETRKALTIASRRLAKLGLTSLHCIVNDLNELVELRKLKREGKILQSIYAIVPQALLDQLTAIGLATERGPEGFRIGGLKLYLDGSLGARTAALKAPYNDDPDSSGMLTMSREELEEVVAKAGRAGFQLCIHSIGDRAVDLAIEVLDGTLGARRCRESRHRIEHASIVTEDKIRKMHELGVIASVQPRFIYSDHWARERLGSERLRDLYPLRSLNREGILLTSGSDCPVEDPNPFEGIWSAVARPGLDNTETLTVSQALVTYSANAAYASFCEDERGTLEPGKIADIIIVDRDPFECTLDSLRHTRVLETIIGGRIFS